MNWNLLSLERFANDQPGRCNLGCLCDHAGWLCHWTISELLDRCGWNCDGFLLQRPETECRPIGVGKCHQSAGTEDAGQRRLPDDTGQRHRIGGTSGTAGLGTLQDGALEQSNVNISAEFSNLIVAQRAFEANSKAVTTFDTVTQETINMIH